MKKIFSLVFLCIWSVSCASLAGDRILYNRAVDSARNSDFNTTFFALRQLLREYPESNYIPDTKFALGEYYFKQNNYRESLGMLSDFLDNYPQHQARVFALAMVYKLFKEYASDKTLEAFDIKIKDKFFNKPLFLLFSRSRNKTYHSFLDTNFTIREYIDKIEILKDNESFLEVSP